MRFAFTKGAIESHNDIDAAVADVPDGDMREAELVVVRIASPLWPSFVAPTASERKQFDRLRAALNSRIGNRAVIALPASPIAGSADLRPRLLADDRPCAPKLPPQDTLEALRSADLFALFERNKSRCVLPSSTGFHYILPSGAHTNQFVRLSEVFSDLPAIDRVAYWIALDICSEDEGSKQDVGLIVDHSSMLVLAARVQGMLKQHNIEIHCLPGYPSSEYEQQDLFRFLTRCAATASRLWTVVCIASTGRLQKLIDRWTLDTRYDRIKTLTLYATQPAGSSSAFCFLALPEYAHFDVHERCALCAQESAPIPIDGNSYLLTKSEPRAVPLKADLFALQQPFLSKFGGVTGALRVHFDDPNETVERHHAFYCDVASLLDCADFVSELRELIKSGPAPDLIVGPEHSAAKRLGLIASETLGAPFFAHDTLRLSESNRDRSIGEAAREAKSILIVDDVLIRGARLNSFNCSLREQPGKFGGIEQVRFLVALVLSPSWGDFLARQRGLTTKHEWKSQLDFLYRVPLPDWHNDAKCPWCRERAYLNKLAQRYPDLDTPFNDRLLCLGNKKLGVTNHWSESVDNCSPPALGAQSAIGLPADTSSLIVLFAVASAVQQLRDAPTDSLASTSFPVPRRLARRVLETNYSERLLQACFLRCLTTTEPEDALKHYLLDQAKALKGPELGSHFARELAIAGLAGQLGPNGADLENYLRVMNLWPYES